MSNFTGSVKEYLNAAGDLMHTCQDIWMSTSMVLDAYSTVEFADPSKEITSATDISDKAGMLQGANAVLHRIHDKVMNVMMEAEIAEYRGWVQEHGTPKHPLTRTLLDDSSDSQEEPESDSRAKSPDMSTSSSSSEDSDRDSTPKASAPMPTTPTTPTRRPITRVPMAPQRQTRHTKDRVPSGHILDGTLLPDSIPRHHKTIDMERLRRAREVARRLHRPHLSRTHTQSQL